MPYARKRNRCRNAIAGINRPSSLSNAIGRRFELSSLKNLRLSISGNLGFKATIARRRARASDEFKRRVFAGGSQLIDAHRGGGNDSCSFWIDQSGPV